MSSSQADRQELAVDAHGHAVGVGRGLPSRVEREGGVDRLGRVEVDASQALAKDPSLVDVIGGRGEPAVLHVGDVPALAVGADRHLAEVVSLDGDRPEDAHRLRRDDRYVLRPGIADEEERAVRRERQAARFAAHGHAGGHAEGFQVNPHHLVGDPHGHESRLAVMRENHSPRLRSDLDAADHGQMIVLDLEHGQVIAEPVRHGASRAVAGDRHPGWPIARRQLMEDLSRGGIDEGHRAGGLIGHEQAVAVRTESEGDRRAVRFLLDWRRGGRDLGALEL